MTIGANRIARLVLVAGLAAGMAAAWRWRALFDPLALTQLVATSPAAPLVFILLHVAASLFFVPRTLLALGAGILFGWWWGVVWAAFGSVAGGIAGFLVARYIYPGFVERAPHGRLEALLRRAERGGWRMVAAVRLMPIIPHSLTNYAMGMTRVGLGAYAVGSLLGQLPLTIGYAELGAAGGRALLAGADWRTQVLWPSLIGVTALALSSLLPLLARRRMRPAPEAL